MVINGYLEYKYYVSTLFIIIICIMGCSYTRANYGSEISDSQIKTIEDGITTKQEVLVTFGEPTKTMNNEKVLFYTWTSGGSSSWFGIESKRINSTALVIVFDDSDIVKSHRITRGATIGSE